MFTKVLVLMVVVGSAVSRPEDVVYTDSGDVYSPPAADLYAEPANIYTESADIHSQPIYLDPIPYSFAYAVNDEYTGADYGHSEHSDGKNVKGSYTVQLPDGRRQTVTYVADHYGGYVANVQYYGEAQYPETYGAPVTFKPSVNVYEPQLGYQ